MKILFLSVASIKDEIFYFSQYIFSKFFCLGCFPGSLMFSLSDNHIEIRAKALTVLSSQNTTQMNP